MITALNMTVPLKQDPESLAKLQKLKDDFADHIQPLIDAALRKSGIVHFARVLVVHDRFIQVLTEFDGDSKEYTEFFRREIPEVFERIFDLAEGTPGWDHLNNQDTFFQASQRLNIAALGRSEDGRADQGWLYDNFGKTVREIEEALVQSSGSTGTGGGGTGGGSTDSSALTAAAAAFAAASAAFTAAANARSGT
ncbi:MAG TPA: hypothetical protein VF759_00765 [Allosphingosinicella sp.]|jgi:hypothetical protein